MIFSQITQAAADPILGLTEAFKADPRNNKVNLGVGIYKTEAGETPILQSVKKAEAKLLKQEKTKNYLGIEGVPAYNEAILPLLFGADNKLITSGRAEAAQAPGGTGALRIASEFIMRNTQSRTVWLSNPTWANHRNVFETAGLTVKEYRYYRPENHDIDFDALMADLKMAKAGDLVLLHACCHNPTGIDPTLEQWQKIGELCRDNNLVPLFDFAYQGFGQGLDEDAAGLRLVASMVPELLVASSFSKNFGLYNERVGAVTLVAADSDTCKRAFSQIKRVIRANYSNPPAHGALIVSIILNDAKLRQEWETELTQMRERIAAMRTLFVDTLKIQGVKQDFSFISRQCGMFSFSGLDQAQVTRLRDEFGVYVVGSGRISVAGMTQANMPKVCQAISAVLAD